MIKGFKWIRPATIERWVDGDTVIVLIDKGEGDYYRPKKGIRLLLSNGGKYDAPEMSGPKADPMRALDALRACEAIAPAGSVIYTTSHELDVYGRPLCSIRTLAGIEVADELLRLGHVKLSVAAENPPR